MEKPAPDEIKKLVKQHLGQAALDIQKKEPLGLWLITADNKARHIPVNTFLNEFVVGMPDDEKEWFLDSMEELDETKEVFIVFMVSETKQFVGRVTLVED